MPFERQLREKNIFVKFKAQGKLIHFTAVVSPSINLFLAAPRKSFIVVEGNNDFDSHNSIPEKSLFSLYILEILGKLNLCYWPIP